MHSVGSCTAGDRLELRHACVPGRIRVHVGNRNGLASTDQLGARIAARADIKDVRVSALTCNITIHFSPATNTQEILDHLRSCLDSVELDGHGGDAEWHTQDADDVAARLSVSPGDGLSYRKAAQRLRKHGPNTLVSVPPRSRAEILLDQFSGLPVILLAGVATYSLLVGALADAFAIGAVLAANAAIGFVTELKAETMIASLPRSEITTIRVVREGRESEIDARDLVPGEIIMVERGEVVPADARLTRARDLSVSEAALTGESLPVRKQTARLAQQSLPLADRTNMLYRGTIVVSGHGKAIVVETGQNTEIGKVQRLASASRPPETPTQAQLVTLGSKMAWVAAGAAGLLLILGLMRGRGVLSLIRSAMALAVASVPEGLPMIATTSHALGVEAMRKHNVIVRRPDALETLASVDVVCLDKTGTLTQNRMSVAEIDCGGSRVGFADGAVVSPDREHSNGIGHLLRIAALCNQVEINDGEGAAAFYGSGTETALLSAAVHWGINVRELRRDNHRKWVREWSARRRLMVSRHDGRFGSFLAIKGEPREVLGRCTDEYLGEGARRALTPARRDEIERRNAEMAKRGLRVLGFAYDNASADSVDAEDAIKDLSWVGLAGLEDPIRESASDAVRQLRSAGIRPLILTGDQLLTAQAIAEKVGVETGGQGTFIDAAELEKLSIDELADVAKSVSVLARITPAQKLRVVEALQRSGSVVAMVGDGVNDSPALRKADVGIALSMRADAAARDVADIILRTDDLRAVAHAVAHGRTAYENVRKSLRFLLSTNSSEVLLMLAGTAVGLGEVLSPMQLLWINLITDVAPGIGLAMEAPAPETMAQPPYARGAQLLDTGEAKSLLRDGSILASGALAAGLYGAARYGADSGQVRTLTFASLIGAQLNHALACRHKDGFEAHDLPPNRELNLILEGSAVVQSAALLAPPLRRFLGLTPFGVWDALVMLGASVAPALVRRFLPIRRDAESPRRPAETEREPARGTSAAELPSPASTWDRVYFCRSKRLTAAVKHTSVSQ